MRFNLLIVVCLVLLGVCCLWVSYNTGELFPACPGVVLFPLAWRVFSLSSYGRVFLLREPPNR